MIQNSAGKIKKPQSSGCFTVLWTFIILAALTFCIFILRPVMVKLIEPGFCKGKIVHRWGVKAEKIMCFDKTTGKETDISFLQIFACCPSVLLMTFLVIALMVSRSILRKNEGTNGR